MKILLLAALCVLSSYAQAVRIDPLPSSTISSAGAQPYGYPQVLAIPGAAVTLCGYPANGFPCTNLATSYTDATLTTACASGNPVVPAGSSTCTSTTDRQGNFGFWVTAGNYAYMLTIKGVTYGPYPISAGSGQSALNPKSLSTIQFADQFSGGDCGAKINAADASIGATAGEIWVNQACGLTWTTPVALSQNRVLRFIQGGVYNSMAANAITLSSGSSLFGGASVGTTLNIGLTTGTGINLATGTTNDVHISDIAITQSGTAVGGDNCVLMNGSRITIDHFYFSGCFNGINIAGTSAININSGSIRSFVNDGILITGGSDQHLLQVVMDYNGTTQPHAGIELQNTGGVWITDSDIIRSGYGLLINPGNGQNVAYSFIINTAFDTNQFQGIFINPTGSGTVYINNFIGVWSSTNGGNGLEIGNTGTVDGVRFVGCRLLNNQLAGAAILGGVNVRLDACDVMGNSQQSIGSFPGITFAAGVSRFSVTGTSSQQEGIFANSQSYGIVVNTGASDHYIITSNDTTNNVTGGISDNGTGTHKVVANNIP